jgi:hypothetical protein
VFSVREADGLCFTFITVEGTLKGWDQLLNLVLDDIEELIVGKYQSLDQSMNAHW